MKVEVSGPQVYRLLHPRPVVLVSCFDPDTEKPNIIAIAWSTPLSMDPPLIGISVGLQRYSHELIKKCGEFIVNIPTMEILEKVAGCGSVSGKTTDKFSKFGLTPLPAKVVKSPAIKECVAHLECKLVDQVRVGDHTFFIGEIVAAYANEKAFDGELINIEEVRGVHHLGGQVYCTLASKSVRLS
jgi:flavin reductase (DIM6/NTAB) family NADH-FMN oxidoreductase RutF